MQATIEETAIMRKTRELCEAILEQPDMQALRQRVSKFMADDKARSLYEGVVTKRQALQEKQQMAQALSGEEISAFEQERDSLLKNDVARGFLDAQDEMNRVQQSIQKYVSKTLELGRVPTEEDLSDGCCSDHGCGCSH